MNNRWRRLLSAAFKTFVLTLFLSNQTHALFVNASVVQHIDPNNYLGLNGLVSLGDNATADFSFSGLPDTSFALDTNRSEHVFTFGQASSVYTVNGLFNPTPAPRGDYSVVVSNDFVGPLGYGDTYLFNQFFVSPEEPYTSLIWSVLFHDSTATAHNNSDFYALGSTAGFDEILITAYLWDAITQTGETLLIATATSAVPLPAGVWLFGSALAGLIGLRARRQ